MNLAPLHSLPDWDDYPRIGLDTETRDDLLTSLGPGVRRGGYVVGISFATPDGQSFYLPVRHEGGGNYVDPDRVFEYLRHQARHFRGEIVGTNLPYDIDYLAEAGVEFRPRRYRDVSITGPLLLEPELVRMQDGEGRWFWGEKFQRMNLDAQLRRAGLDGKAEDGLRAWAEERGLSPKADMWRAPAGVVDEYARVDASAPLELLELHEREIERQGLGRVYDLESRLLPVLVKMRRRGVRVDVSKLDAIEARALQFETRAVREVSRLSGVTLTTDDTNTSAALALALKACDIKVPKTEVKISEKTGKPTGGNDSVTSPWLRGLRHPVADAILVAKRWNKVRLTFCASVRDHAIRQDDGTYRIHCTFNQLRQEQDDGETRGAQFGRLSCSDPNLQQQPARDPEIGPMWRSIYLPDHGGEWCTIDFSSQEPRMAAHYAEAMAENNQLEFPEWMRWDRATRGAARAAAEACRTDPEWDNHSMMAGFIFDDYTRELYVSGDKRAKLQRDRAKIMFLGRLYGMGGGKLCRSLGLPTEWVVRDPRERRWTTHPASSPEGKALRLAGARPFEVAGPEGREIIAKFDAGVPYARGLTKLVQNAAERRGYIRTLSGRKRRFARRPDTGEIVDGHKALNGLIQGGSGDQTKLAMVLADDSDCYMQLQVHDEIDTTIWHPDEARALSDIMIEAQPLRVPTRTDIETGPSWGEIK